MISKELLSEVINKNILSCEFDIYGNIDYKVVNDYGSCINIYELSHKFKEWAYNKGYMMKIENHYSNSIQIRIRKPATNSMYKEPWKKTFKNEIEGIITVCEWIYRH